MLVVQVELLKTHVVATGDLPDPIATPHISASRYQFTFQRHFINVLISAYIYFVNKCLYFSTLVILFIYY